MKVINITKLDKLDPLKSISNSYTISEGSKFHNGECMSIVNEFNNLGLDKPLEQTLKQLEHITLFEEESKHYRTILKVMDTKETCLHRKCDMCNGTGINKITKSACIHFISCPCDLCAIK